MTNLRFAMFGAGFWSLYQLAGSREVGGVECVAICDPNRDKVIAQVEKFGIPKGYNVPQALLASEELDFIDICTAVESHASITKLAAEHGLPVVCQKPMATTLAESIDMIEFCQQHNIPLFINENWCWQVPIRQFKRLLDEGRIGKPFRATIDMNSGYGVFQNQPFLAELEQFIITDLGTHTLDVARFLFGEATRLYCQTYRAHPNIKGENVATILLNMANDIAVPDQHRASPARRRAGRNHWRG
jgi:predicted dehydrogenase